MIYRARVFIWTAINRVPLYEALEGWGGVGKKGEKCIGEPPLPFFSVRTCVLFIISICMYRYSMYIFFRSYVLRIFSMTPILSPRPVFLFRTLYTSTLLIMYTHESITPGIVGGAGFVLSSLRRAFIQRVFSRGNNFPRRTRSRDVQYYIILYYARVYLYIYIYTHIIIQ